MSRFTKKKKEHIGLSPYALVFRGQKKTDKILLQAMDFDLESVRELEVKTKEGLLSLKNSKSLSWLNIYGLDNVETMEELAQVFAIDDNILSDVMNPSLRPKVQEFENGLFCTI